MTYVGCHGKQDIVLGSEMNATHVNGHNDFNTLNWILMGGIRKISHEGIPILH